MDNTNHPAKKLRPDFDDGGIEPIRGVSVKLRSSSPPAELMDLIHSVEIHVNRKETAEDCEAEALARAREFFGQQCHLFVEGGWQATRAMFIPENEDLYFANIVVWALGPLPGQEARLHVSEKI